MYTYQDFIKEKDRNTAIVKAIAAHRSSEIYKVACDADLYDAQRNSTITNYTKFLYTMEGAKIPDKTASNNKLCSNFFRRLNTQRVTYSLGNGVTFTEEGTKEKLGNKFDTRLKSAAYYGCIHGVSFIFWNVDHIHVFKATEFAPLWDEETGILRAGIRFWQIDPDKPGLAVLYEEDGYTQLMSDKGFSDFKVKEEKRAYKMTIESAPADECPEVIAEENYSVLPIIPLYGSELKQSTLIGMKGKIDAFDLIRSGYANDLDDCSEIYWIVSNAGGMTDSDLAQFRDRLKLNHIATVPDSDEVGVTPYTQEVPYQSRQSFLDSIRAGIYEDFGGLDVHTVAAGATNDHIDAAYQPLDENADDFEYQIVDAMDRLFAIIGIEDTPIFKRNRISNEKETSEMVLGAANYLDDETVLSLLPFISPEMVQTIKERKMEENMARYEPQNEPVIEE